MVLAAGRGERLRPVTDSVPKSLVEIDGQALLERHLRSLARGGVETVVINLGWLGEQIIERIGSGEKFGLNVVYSQEGENILETGGGIHRALPMLGADPFLVINADIYTDMPLPDVQLGGDDMAHLVCVPVPQDQNDGDFAIEDGRIRNDGEPMFTFSGVSVYRPEFFAGCTPGRFSVVPMLRAAVDADTVSGSIYSGLWRDVGTPERLADCREPPQDRCPRQGASGQSAANP
jgi:MurNAc alpha-1-phosphate uridylyltransferase